MKSRFLLFILCFVLKIISSKEELELKKGESINITKINMENNAIYICSKNSISGIYTYDIKTPYLVNVSFGTSESKEILPSFQEGHKENISNFINGSEYKYLFSVPIFISNDDKYTFIKIMCINESECIKDNENMNVKLFADDTWKIAIMFLFIFLFVIATIFLTCYFARNCLTKCCNFIEL